MRDHPNEIARQRFTALEQEVVRLGPELAVFLVYDRPARVAERPGLERTYFAQRCVSDEQLDQTVSAFRSIGAYVELFEGERPFIQALASGRIDRLNRRLKIVYNGIEGSVAHDAFAPGRKALIPALADSYGLLCANSNAYACALGRHKFHYLTLLQRLGVPTPSVWHYRAGKGWAAGRRPPAGLKVIAKSTFESWSVGVTEESVFDVHPSSLDTRVAAIADEIGQAVTVQAFVAGVEVCVPVLGIPEPVIAPPVEAILAKAPGDPTAVMTIHDNLAQAGVTYQPVDSLEVAAALADLTRAAFALLELDGLARIDYRVAADGSPHIIDVGVSPGLATGGSSAASFGSLGLGHTEFLRCVIGAALPQAVAAYDESV